MGLKSTQHIKRGRALEILLSEIPLLPNDALGNLMDALADCGCSKIVSEFDNFIVSEFDNDDTV